MNLAGKEIITRSISEVPLASVAKEVCPLKDQLLWHFDRIASATEPGAGLLASILFIVASTYCDRREVTKRSLSSFSAPSRPAATAAHPRGFRGTKLKPPKSPAPQPSDYRHALCDPGTCNELLTELFSWKEAAIVECESSISKQYGNLRRLDATGWNADAVRVLINHDENLSRAVGLTPLFDRLFFNRIKGADIRQVREYARLSRILEVMPEQDAALILELLHYCHGPESALYIFNLLSQHLDNCSAIANTLLLSALPKSARVTLITPDELRSVMECEAAAGVSFLPSYFEGLANGVSASYLLYGFSIAAEHQLRCSFDNVQPAQISSTYRFELIHSRVKDAERYWSSFPFWLWEAYQSFPELNQLLGKDSLLELNSDDLLHLLISLVSGATSVDHRTFINRYFDKFMSVLLGLDGELRRYFIDKLSSLLGFRAKHLNELFARLIQLCDHDEALLKLWSAGFFEAVASNVIDADFKKCLNLPFATMKQIQDFYRTQNHILLLDWGFDSLFKILPDFSMEALTVFPVKLLRAARALGTLPNASMDALPVRMTSHRLFQLSWARLSDSDLLRYEMDCRDFGLRSPVPRKLHHHITGAVQLPALKVERLRAKLLHNALLLKLELLENAIAEELTAGRGVLAADLRIREALQLANSADGNKRAFNKFLSALMAGRSDYLSTHPLTLSWIKRNASVNLNALADLPALRVELSDLGSISIALERDPLEALRLGTALNTCLGTGGSCSYSAIANVLDVNKFVIFARNHRGSIVARQLAAISDQGALVCFDVYAASSSDELRPLFWQFDRALADALNVPIHDPAKDYVVELIIASEWWDDFACGVGDVSSGQG